MPDKSALDDFIVKWEKLLPTHHLINQAVIALNLELAKAIRDDLEAIRKGTNDGVH